MAWVLYKRQNKFIVERVYINSVNMIELVFSNKIRRKFKNIEGYHVYHDPKELVTPSQGEDGTMVWS